MDKALIANGNHCYCDNKAEDQLGTTLDESSCTKPCNETPEFSCGGASLAVVDVYDASKYSGPDFSQE